MISLVTSFAVWNPWSSEDNQSPPKKQQVNMLESTANISVEVLRPSPVKKQRKQQKPDEFGLFASAEPYSANFITEYCLFRTKFHEARPTGSHNDFGWHNQLVKEWPKWVEDKLAASLLPGNANISTIG